MLAGARLAGLEVSLNWSGGRRGDQNFGLSYTRLMTIMDNDGSMAEMMQTTSSKHPMCLLDFHHFCIFEIVLK